MLEVKNVSYAYKTKKDKTILNNVSATFEEGIFYTIIGPSGAGKTTLLSLLAGLDTAVKGTVLCNGEDITKKGLNYHRKHNISLVFQNYNLIDYLTTVENVKLGGSGNAEKLLEEVGIGKEYWQRNVLQLSGGQQQRVAIARALATNPKILLCDEATSALDPTTTKSILALLKEINQKYGITIVIITHEMAVVQEIGTHVAIIDHGELAESGTVEEVFTHPRSKAARKLVLMDDDNHYDEMKGQHCIRIVFKSNSSFEPVIALSLIHI